MTLFFVFLGFVVLAVVILVFTRADKPHSDYEDYSDDN
jgi:hypothetical protein